MTKFRVTVSVVGTEYFEVDAQDKTEAIERAVITGTWVGEGRKDYFAVEAEES